MKVAVAADVVHGELHIASSQRTALREAVLVWTDGPVTVTVEREQATRSAQANAYYWGVAVKALAEHTGYTPDEMHEVLKAKFLPKEVALRRHNGTVFAEYVIGGSTTQLGTVEFFDYVEGVRQWAFEELDVSIPPPDPEWREHAEQERRDREDRERRHRDIQENVRPGSAGAPPEPEAGGGRRRHRRLGNGSVGQAVD